MKRVNGPSKRKPEHAGPIPLLPLSTFSPSNSGVLGVVEQSRKSWRAQDLIERTKIAVPIVHLGKEKGDKPCHFLPSVKEASIYEVRGTRCH